MTCGGKATLVNVVLWCSLALGIGYYFLGWEFIEAVLAGLAIMTGMAAIVGSVVGTYYLLHRYFCGEWPS